MPPRSRGHGHPEDREDPENGDILLVTRFGGVIAKHDREKWWDHYGPANQLIPG